jgi:hypothetical protein
VTLKFNEKVHRYWYQGRPIPGVTTLIQGGLPAPALIRWAAKSVAEWVVDHDAEVEQLRGMGRNSAVAAIKEVPWTARDRAGIRGTDVHNLAEKLVHGQEVEVPDHLYDHVQSCVQFLDRWQPEPIVVEKPLAHPAHNWAGKPDLIAKMPNGENWLLDWKTADSGIFVETSLQLAAYSHAAFWAPDEDTESPMPEIARCAAVHITSGGYSVVPVKADDEAYAAFRHVAWVAQAAKRMKDESWVGTPIEFDELGEVAAA